MKPKSPTSVKTTMANTRAEAGMEACMCRVQRANQEILGQQQEQVGATDMVLVQVPGLTSRTDH
mgnify:CR=1 FL=1